MVKAQVLQKTQKPEKHKVKKIPKLKAKDKLQKKKTWSKPTGGKGVVYLSHIPHGFYEDQIESYFKQFGKVTAVSVPRSKTGRMRGYAFIEFKHPEVGQIAADTMNNYLMFNRLLKAKYIPPEQQKPKYFLAAQAAKITHTTPADRSELMVKHNRKLKNRMLKISLEAKHCAKLLRRKKKLEKRLEGLGLDHNFQVQEGDLESIFKRNKEQKKKKKDDLDSASAKEDLPSDDDEDLSLSLESDEDLSSFEEMETLSEDYNAEEQKPKKLKKTVKKNINKKTTQAPEMFISKPKQKLNKVKNKSNKNSMNPLKQKQSFTSENLQKETGLVKENNTADTLKLGGKNKKSKHVDLKLKQKFKDLPINISIKSRKRKISSDGKTYLVKTAQQQPSKSKEVNSTQVKENNTAVNLKLNNKNKKSKQVDSQPKHRFKDLSVNSSSKASKKLIEISPGHKKSVVNTAPQQSSKSKNFNINRGVKSLLSDKLVKKSSSKKSKDISLSPVSSLKSQKKPRHRVIKRGSLEK